MNKKIKKRKRKKSLAKEKKRNVFENQMKAKIPWWTKYQKLTEDKTSIWFNWLIILASETTIGQPGTDTDPVFI